jgi:hypothetical protein
MPRSMSTRIAGLLSLGLVSSLTAQPVIAVTSPGANAAGIVVSNAGELVLGAK